MFSRFRNNRRQRGVPLNESDGDDDGAPPKSRLLPCLPTQTRHQSIDQQSRSPPINANAGNKKAGTVLRHHLNSPEDSDDNSTLFRSSAAKNHPSRKHRRNSAIIKISSCSTFKRQRAYSAPSLEIKAIKKGDSNHRPLKNSTRQMSQTLLNTNMPFSKPPSPTHKVPFQAIAMHGQGGAMPNQNNNLSSSVTPKNIINLNTHNEMQEEELEFSHAISSPSKTIKLSNTIRIWYQMSSMISYPANKGEINCDLLKFVSTQPKLLTLFGLIEFLTLIGLSTSVIFLCTPEKQNQIMRFIRHKWRNYKNSAHIFFDLFSLFNPTFNGVNYQHFTLPTDGFFMLTCLLALAYTCVYNRFIVYYDNVLSDIKNPSKIESALQLYSEIKTFNQLNRLYGRVGLHRFVNGLYNATWGLFTLYLLENTWQANATYSLSACIHTNLILFTAIAIIRTGIEWYLLKREIEIIEFMQTRSLSPKDRHLIIREHFKSVYYLESLLNFIDRGKDLLKLSTFIQFTLKIFGTKKLLLVSLFALHAPLFLANPALLILSLVLGVLIVKLCNVIANHVKQKTATVPTPANTNQPIIDDSVRVTSSSSNRHSLFSPKSKKAITRLSVNLSLKSKHVLTTHLCRCKARSDEAVYTPHHD